MKIHYQSAGDPKAWALLQDLEEDYGPWIEFVAAQVRRALERISDFRLGPVAPSMNLPCRRAFLIRSDLWNSRAQLTFMLRIGPTCRLVMVLLTGEKLRGPVIVFKREVAAKKPNVERALRKLFDPELADRYAKGIKAAVKPPSPKHWMPARKGEP
jgi:hypothetical protein